MELSEFRKNVTIIKSEKIREQFVNAFVDKNAPGYKEDIDYRYIEHAQKYYLGYLWDYMDGINVILRDSIPEKLSFYKTILAMWDMHSSNKIVIPAYWKFGRDSIIEAHSELLWLHLHYLPDDIYFFDHTFTWAIALTHENINSAQYCLEWIPPTNTQSRTVKFYGTTQL